MPWDSEQILGALYALDEAALPDDAIDLVTKDYRLARFPERLLSPTFPAAQVIWSRTTRPFDVVFDEVARIVQEWAVATVHWWVTDATRPIETESMLRSRGGSLSDSNQILARELDKGALRDPAFDVELVCDERTLQAALLVEARGWGRASLDEAGIARQYAETLDDLETWSGFQVVVFIGGEPAAIGRCTIHGNVARLWGAVTLPEFRGLGCYRAVLAARMRYAHAHGATIALTRGRTATSSPILLRSGFTSHGEERCYRVTI